MKQHCVRIHKIGCDTMKQISGDNIATNHYTLIEGQSVEYLTTYTNDDTINIFVNDPLTRQCINVIRLKIK